MRILSLAHTYPWPPWGGSEVRIWEMARAMAERGHEVRLLTSGPRPSGAAGGLGAPPLPSIPGLVVESFPCTPIAGGASGVVGGGGGVSAWAKRGGLALASLVRGIPASTLARRSPLLAARVRALAAEGWPDIAVAEEGSAAIELAALPRGIPRVLVKHSVHAVELEEEPRRSLGHAVRLAVRALAVRRYEQASLRAASLVVALTEEDGADLARRYGPLPLAVVPNGVDRAALPWRADPCTAVVGCLASFAWGRNLDEAAWLVREVWPRVLARAPAARLRLVGHGLGDAARARLAGERVELHGHADDLAAALADVSVGALPVRFGTGIRNRLLALASLGIPTVTTPLGARGLGAADDRGLRLAEEPDAMAAAIVDLLGDPVARARVGVAAGELAARFSWSAAAERLEEALARLVAAGARARRSRVP